MEWFNFPLVQLCCFFTFGILGAAFFAIDFTSLGYLLLSLFLIATILHVFAKKRGCTFIFFNVCVYILFLGLGSYFYLQAISKLELAVKTDNTTQHFYATAFVSESDYYLTYYGEIRANKANEQHKILVKIKKDNACSYLNLGQLYATQIALTPIAQPKNPGVFNYANYLYYKGVNAQLKGSAQAIVALPIAHKSLRIWAAKLQLRLQETLKAHIKNNQNAAILASLLLGQRSDLSAGLKTRFTTAGVMHILAISGLHLGIVILVFNFLLRPLKTTPWGKVIRMICVLVALWSFACITGLQASVVRAAVMFSMFTIAQNLGRQGHSMNTLFVSFLLLLVWNPLYLFQVGFLMSYAAVYFILWLNPLIQPLFKPKTWLTRKLWGLVRISFIAQLGVLPLSLYFFNAFPVYFLLANVLILPLVGPILSLGLVLLALAYFGFSVSLGFQVLEFLIACVQAVATWIGNLPKALITQIQLSELQVIILYGFCIGLVQTIVVKPKYILRYASFGLLVFTLALVAKLDPKTPQHLWLLDTMGTTTLARLNNNQIQLYANNNEPAKYWLGQYKNSRRINSVSHHSLPKYFETPKGCVLIIQEAIAVPIQLTSIDYLVLTNNAKINLDQWIETLQPAFILADGSSYNSTKARWQQTAKNKKLPYYDTSQMGAFNFY